MTREDMKMGRVREKRSSVAAFFIRCIFESMKSIESVTQREREREGESSRKKSG